MPIAISWQGATLGANTFTGAQVAPSLALGGTTSSFPSLMRYGAAVAVRLADNSDDASLYAASFTLGTAGLAVLWLGRSQIKSPADGNLLLQNNAADNFTRLQFGGTTSSFPAIKRVAAALHARLADDSNYADVVAARFSADSGIVFFGSNGALIAPSDGTFKMTNNAGTDFTLLQFGGTTSSFPAWQRVGAGFFAKVADNSANTYVAMSQLLVTDGITAPVATVGYAKLYVDTADGDLKVIFGDGIIKTLTTDT